MHLTIVLRKEVDNEEQADNLLAVVKQRLIDYPDVTVTGSVSIALPLPEPPPG